MTFAFLPPEREDAAMTQLESSVLLACASAGATLTSVATLVVFLVLALTVVRRERPDAAPLLAYAVALEIVVAFAGFASSVLIPIVLNTTKSSRSYPQAQAINTVVFAVLRTAAQVMLICGVVRLTRPARSAHATR